MVNPECFDKEWIEGVRKEFPLIYPTILEKTIYAFQLLSLMVEEGIEFVFKGGTSLLLILPEPKRLSIDIDILTNLQKNDLEPKLRSVARNKFFTELIEDPRTDSKIPKKHYKFFLIRQSIQRLDLMFFWMCCLIKTHIQLQTQKF